MKNRQVFTDKELNAIVQFDNSFKFMVSYDDLSEYNKGFVNWHKQSTVEISVVVEGSVNVYVLEKEVTVKAGDGFVIMPGFLHSVRPTRKTDCAKYFTLIFHPELLYGIHGSFYENAFYLPFVNSKTPYYIISSKEMWSDNVFSKLKEIATAYPFDTPENRLWLQHTLQNIWVILSERLSIETNTSTKNTRKILEMIVFLHEHYNEKFSLTAMSNSVLMSRNECCRYFKKMMNMTISEYLLEYRLSVAKELIETSELTITEISEQSGFCDVSYFIKVFKQYIGSTPKAYAYLKKK